jgi:predicted ATPase
MRVVADSFNSASWDWEEYLPLVNEQKHTRSRSGYDLASTVIAFHYALLAMKFKEPKVHTNHPGLLIVDEPEQQNMPTETYLKIMALLRNLAESHKDSIQVIVAATAVPEDMKEHVIEF